MVLVGGRRDGCGCGRGGGCGAGHGVTNCRPVGTPVVGRVGPVICGGGPVSPTLLRFRKENAIQLSSFKRSDGLVGMILA